MLLKTRKITKFSCTYDKSFDRVEWRRLLHALRRMGIDWRDRRLNNRKPVHGTANASKNKWRVLGTGEDGQRCETGMPAFTTTIHRL